MVGDCVRAFTGMLDLGISVGTCIFLLYMQNKVFHTRLSTSDFIESNIAFSLLYKLLLPVNGLYGQRMRSFIWSMCKYMCIEHKNQFPDAASVNSLICTSLFHVRVKI